jgi:hypothetical protein
VFIESFCRVQSLSLSGLLLYPLVDEFVVQWPQLVARQQQPHDDAKQGTAPRTTSNSADASPRQLTEQEEQQLAVAAKSSAVAASSVPAVPRGWRYAKYIGRLC